MLTSFINILAGRGEVLYEEVFTVDLLAEARCALRLPIAITHGRVNLWFERAGCYNAYSGEVLLYAIESAPRADGQVEATGQPLRSPQPPFVHPGSRHGYHPERGPLSVPFSFQRSPQIIALELVLRLHSTFAGSVWAERFPTPQPERVQVQVERSPWSRA